MQENLVMRLTGDLTIFPIVDGVEQKGIGPLPASSLSYQPQADSIDVMDTRKDKRGQLIVSVADPKPMIGTLEIVTTPVKLLSMYSQGDVGTVNETTTTVTRAAVAWEPDLWTRLPHRNLSTVVIDDGATPVVDTWVEGTDYELNAARGMFRPIMGSDMANATSGKISYSAGAVTGSVVNISGKPTVRARLEFDAVNDANDGKPVVWVADSVLMTPNGELDLASDKPTVLKFKLKFEAPSGTPATLEMPTLA